MHGAIIVVNSGASSVEFSGYDLKGERTPILLVKGQLTGFGTLPYLVVRNACGGILLEKTWVGGDTLNHKALFTFLIGWIQDYLGGEMPLTVGHRFFRGGKRFFETTLLDSAVIEHLQSLYPLAPLHQPHNLAAIRA